MSAPIPAVPAPLTPTSRFKDSSELHLERERLKTQLKHLTKLIRNAKRRSSYVSRPRPTPWERQGLSKEIYEEERARRAREYKREWRAKRKQSSETLHPKIKVEDTATSADDDDDDSTQTTAV